MEDLVYTDISVDYALFNTHTQYKNILNNKFALHNLSVVTECTWFVHFPLLDVSRPQTVICSGAQASLAYEHPLA